MPHHLFSIVLYLQTVFWAPTHPNSPTGTGPGGQFFFRWHARAERDSTSTRFPRTAPRAAVKVGVGALAYRSPGRRTLAFFLKKANGRCGFWWRPRKSWNSEICVLKLVSALKQGSFFQAPLFAPPGAAPRVPGCPGAPPPFQYSIISANGVLGTHPP